MIVKTIILVASVRIEDIFKGIRVTTVQWVGGVGEGKKRIKPEKST